MACRELKDRINSAFEFLKRFGIGEVARGLTYEDFKVRANVPPLGPNDVPEQFEFWKSEVFSPQDFWKEFDVTAFMINRIINDLYTEVERSEELKEEFHLAAEEFLRNSSDDVFVWHAMKYYFEQSQDLYEFSYEILHYKKLPWWKNLMKKFEEFCKH